MRHCGPACRRRTAADRPPGRRRPARTTKLAIVGAGAVGPTMAYAALMRGAARTVALHDINAGEGRGRGARPRARHPVHADGRGGRVGRHRGVRRRRRRHGHRGCQAEAGPDPHRPRRGHHRAGPQVLPALVEVAPDADLRHGDQPRRRRHLRRAARSPACRASSCSAAARCWTRPGCATSSPQHSGVAVQNVHAYIAGEHGDTEFPLWRLGVASAACPLLEWTVGRQPGPLDAARCASACTHEVVDSAYRIIAGKGATNYAIALAGIADHRGGPQGRASRPAGVVAAGRLPRHQRRLPVRALARGRGRGGAPARVPMSDDELAGLRPRRTSCARSPGGSASRRTAGIASRVAQGGEQLVAAHVPTPVDADLGRPTVQLVQRPLLERVDRGVGEGLDRLLGVG